MPRVLAMVLVYLVAIALFGFLAYITVKTLIPQLNSFAQSVQTFVTPGSNGQESPLDQTLKSLGFTQSQINSATKQLQSQLSSSASDIAKGTEQLDGRPDQCRVQHLDHRGSKCVPAGRWLPLRQLADRQFTALPTRLGLLGSRDLTARGGWLYPRADHHVDLYGGDAVCRYDHPRGAVCPLIGVLAFVLEFIPDIGTIITGFVAVVIALTVSWQLALITLIYTIIVDCIEGYVLSPRIIGRAVEIKPVVSLLAMIAGSELFGIWGAILAAPTMGLIQALVGAYWQYYEKTHAQEFPLEKIEQAANPQEEPTQPAINEPAVDGP